MTSKDQDTIAVSCGSMTNLHSASPVQIPGRQCSTLARPMRSSVEGLNQEIERLVLHPGMGRANRLDQVSALRGCTPEDRHSSPSLIREDEAVPSGSRSAHSQTPIEGLSTAELYYSDDSHESLSPTDEHPLGHPRSFGRTGSAEASPRINKFMAKLPPEGCERVLSRTVESEEVNPNLSNIIIIKPVAGFQLRPSRESAFRVATTLSTETETEGEQEGAVAAVIPPRGDVVE